MAAPAVYTAVTAITAEFAKAGIPKAHLNPVDDYQYRSIDDVLGRLSPLLAKHRLCVLPRVLERTAVERCGTSGSLLLNVSLRVAYDLVSSEDGTTHRIEAYGEALDPSDKATAKAMSAAYKSAMVQAFCIPAVLNEDADKSSHKLKANPEIVEPVQGWEQWAFDIGDIVNVCESQQAIDLVQDRNRAALAALSRERPDLYTELGCLVSARRDCLMNSSKKARQRLPNRRGPTAGSGSKLAAK